MEKYIELIEKKLDEYLPVLYPQDIFNSMRYSVLAGGKRLRPIMCLETCKMFGGNIEDALPTACAVEMLHTQSLIHDDLPCMDNDDFRRGKPSNHKVYGEANAVLAGDALLSFAPQIIIEKSENLSADTKLKVIHEFCIAAGVYGIIAGQVADIEAENKEVSPETLEFIHTHKTADLFKFAIVSGAVIAGANEKQIQDMKKLSQHVGFAFQICDDILDETSTFEEMGKTLGKDKAAHKATYTSLYGIEKARQDLVCHLDKACDIIDQYGNSRIFNQIIKSIREKALRD